jgi:TetR/AcrR family transcriptional repressor of nem operon
MPTSPTVADRPGTRESILDVAERLVQQRGYNGFSFADVAAELGVTKAALHYHFETKGALGHSLIERYRDRFGAGLAAIDASALAPPERLRAYAELYRGVLVEDRMCLCGMLAAEYRTLPAPMRESVDAFFAMNQAWLEGLIAEGVGDGSLAEVASVPAAARMVVATLEGAMLMARPHADTPSFEAVATQLVTELRRASG